MRHVPDAPGYVADLGAHLDELDARHGIARKMPLAVLVFPRVNADDVLRVENRRSSMKRMGRCCGRRARTSVEVRSFMAYL